MPLNGFDRENRKQLRVADYRRKVAQWRDKATTATECGKPETARRCQTWAAEWQRRVDQLLNEH